MSYQYSNFFKRKNKLILYFCAFLIGLLLVFCNFSDGALLGKLPSSAFALSGDFLQHIIGQIYYLQQPWGKNLLIAHKLDAPNGVSIGLTDSIPLEIIFIKLLHHLFPNVQQGVSIFLAICWFLQPLCAVFALRSIGEKRFLPNIAVAVFAACMPTYLNRIEHTALCAHWILLLALGLYFRSVNYRDSKVYIIILSIITILTLLIHPYLMVMVLLLQLAFPLGKLSESKSIKKSILYFIPNLITISIIFVIGYILKYWDASGGGGYGQYSMNIASLFWPAHSSLFPNFASVDATGAQYFEGYQYLGAGFLILILAIVATNNGRRIFSRAYHKYQGLFIVCIGLIFISVSNKIYFFHINLLHLPFHFPGAKQLRSSGRFFWPVSYFVLLGCVGSIRKVYPRVWPVILMLCMVLQWVDTHGLRMQLKNSQNIFSMQETDSDRKAMELISNFKNLEIYPRLECDMSNSDLDMKYIYLAAIKNMPVNTMYLARTPKALKCDPQKDQPHEVNADTLVLLTGSHAVSLANTLEQSTNMICQPFNGHEMACFLKKKQ